MEKVNKIKLPQETIDKRKELREKELKKTSKDIAKEIRQRRNDERAEYILYKLFPFLK